MIWNVYKWCRKVFTRSDNRLCRHSDEVDDLGKAAFACCNEEIREAACRIIVCANAASRIIAKDVLLMLWQFSVDNLSSIFRILHNNC